MKTRKVKTSASKGQKSDATKTMTFERPKTRSQPIAGGTASSSFGKQCSELQSKGNGEDKLQETKRPKAANPAKIRVKDSKSTPKVTKEIKVESMDRSQPSKDSASNSSSSLKSKKTGDNDRLKEGEKEPRKVGRPKKKPVEKTDSILSTKVKPTDNRPSNRNVVETVKSKRGRKKITVDEDMKAGVGEVDHGSPISFKIPIEIPKTPNSKSRPSPFPVEDIRGRLCPVLQDTYDELDRAGRGPKLLPIIKEPEISRAWNLLDDADCVNDCLMGEENYFASVGLVRTGVQEKWRCEKLKRCETLSRRAFGRLRPNPKPTKFGDMVSTSRKRGRKPKPPCNVIAKTSGRVKAASKVLRAICKRKGKPLLPIQRRGRRRKQAKSAPVSVAGSSSSSTKMRSGTRPKRATVKLREKLLNNHLSWKMCYTEVSKNTKKEEKKLSGKRKVVEESGKPSKKPRLEETLTKVPTPRKEVEKEKPRRKKVNPLQEFKHVPDVNESSEYCKVKEENFEVEDVRKKSKGLPPRFSSKGGLVNRGRAVNPNEWPPRHRELTMLDRLILGLECKIQPSEDADSVEINGVTKNDFETLRQRIAKSVNFYFGFIQFIPAEGSSSQRDEYDCCIKYNTNPYRPRPAPRPENHLQAESSSTSRRQKRELNSSISTAQRLSLRARCTSPMKSGAAKRKYPMMHAMDRSRRWPSSRQPDEDFNQKRRRSESPTSGASSGGQDFLSSFEPDLPKKRPMSGSPMFRKQEIIEEDAFHMRRHSPKKHIRKVYTANATVPKILNRKRPVIGPSSSSSMVPIPGSSSLSMGTSSMTLTKSYNTAPSSTSASSMIRRAPLQGSSSTSPRAASTSGVTSVSASGTVSQNAMSKKDSVDFWKLKSAEQYQIMDRHILTPATAMSASQILKLKKMEAETSRRAEEYVHNQQQYPFTVTSILSSARQTSPNRGLSEMMHAPPNIEIDEEETDDDFELSSSRVPHMSLKSTGVVRSAPSPGGYSGTSSQIKQNVPVQASVNSRMMVQGAPVQSGMTLTPTNSPTLESGGLVEESPGKSKRTLIHKFHSKVPFRKILPKTNAVQPPQQPSNSTIVLKDDGTKTQSPGKMFSAVRRAFQANSSSGESSGTREDSGSTKRGPPALLKSLLESDRDLPSPLMQQSSVLSSALQSVPVSPWNQQAHQSRGTWQVAKPRSGMGAGSVQGMSVLRKQAVLPKTGRGAQGLPYSIPETLPMHSVLANTNAKTQDKSEVVSMEEERSFSPPPVVSQLRSCVQVPTISNTEESCGPKICSIQVVDHTDTPSIAKPSMK